MRVGTFIVFCGAALSGCSGIPSVPYEEPAPSEAYARVRVITNSTVYGDSIVGSCAPAVRHQMAEAGRFSRDGEANISYPQYPLKPPGLGMPKRVASPLAEYVPGSRMAEGAHKEVVAEYRVRADQPFQIATRGASIGGYGTLRWSCGAQALVYKLKPGKDYEALVGVGPAPNNNGAPPVMCIFEVIELMPLPGTSVVIPLAQTPAAPPQVFCKN